MNKEELKRIDELIKEIKSDLWDNESVHGHYDEIIKIIAEHYEPKIVDKLDETVKDVDFWYA